MKIIEFWKHVNLAKELIQSGEKKKLLIKLENIRQFIIKEESIHDRKKYIEYFDKFKHLYNLEEYSISLDEMASILEDNGYELSEVSSKLDISIDNYVDKIGKGVSLVTCCMNRNENLVKALPSWINCEEISEIIIVDWSSQEPVFDYIKKQGIKDKRIKVIRVEDQARWILSYAFNIGFRMASYDKILKTDADIIIKDDFFIKNKLTDSTFISGDWRIAAKGQEHINGFFYVYQESLMRIKGFNEYITTYGWDDDDIYNRLELSGTKRTHVDTETIYHIPHDDALRISIKSESKDHLVELQNSPKFKIRTNRFIANTMPTWNKDRVFLPFKVKNIKDGLVTIYKSGESIHYVPDHIRDEAEYFAAIELTSWQAGLRVFELDKQNLRKLLKMKTLDQINHLDIEIAIHNQVKIKIFKPNYIVIKLSSNVVAKYQDELRSALIKLEKLVSLENKGLVIASNSYSQIASILPSGSSIGFIPSWRNYGTPATIKVTDINNMLYKNESMQILLDESSVFELKNLKVEKLNVLSESKDKFYIDAQHGLGNRLRAIASAAAIAEATNRELVIVWEPDHHCECKLSDLFDYDGSVIEKAFVSKVKSKGLVVYNYMEIEEGSNKDSVIKLEEGRDIYARSAYVLNSEYTSWEKENNFLQTLKPTDQVLKLLEPYDVSNSIGAHIRMEAGKGLDNNTYDSVENWTEEGHEQLHYWRDKSHYSHFVKRIDQLFQENPNISLFLATDLPETYKIFEKYYGDKLNYIKRNAYDRSKEQIIYALADVILLSRCERLLGSTWSSFSELALRLSKKYSKTEMSGKDF